jgi:hypothetical protein
MLKLSQKIFAASLRFIRFLSTTASPLTLVTPLFTQNNNKDKQTTTAINTRTLKLEGSC